MSSLTKQFAALAAASLFAVPVFAQDAAAPAADKMAPAPAKMAAGDKKDIVDTAVAAGQFTTLAKLVTAAGLADTLKGAGPFTVFAPTDDAFSKVPPATLADLAKPENKEKLASILTYHVVSGKVMAADAVKLDGKSAKTVNGAEIKISVDAGKVKINNATVSKADIDASNGVIHVIDTVLMPPADAKK